ncbi:MAG: class I SAM-dependent methyltransferase [Pseudomonadota bacterium]
MEKAAYLEMAQVENDHWWFRARRTILREQLAALSPNGSSKVLEVGAGPGGNLAMLRDFGEVTACEMDEEARDIATSRHPDIRVAYGKLPETLPFDDEQFDIIAMFDVIEHIEDDVGALARLRPVAEGGGRLILTTPAYQWMWSAHDVRLHHFRRYTKGRLKTVLETAGWQIDKIGYFNTFLFPLAAAARVKDKVTKSTVPTGMAVPPKPFGSMLEGVFSSERHWLKHGTFPFGLSLLALAKPAPQAAPKAIAAE